MRRHHRLTAGLAALLVLPVGGLPLLLSGCLAGPDGDGAWGETATALSNGAVSATLALQSSWNTGYCADVTIRNGGNAAVRSWRVGIQLNQSAVTQMWNGTPTTASGVVTVAPTSNANIAPGAAASFGFCANKTGNSFAPVLVSLVVDGQAGPGGATGGSSGTGGVSGGTGGAPRTGGTTGSTGGATGSSGGTSGGSGGAPAGACQRPAPPADLKNTIDLTWAEMTGQFEGKVGARPRGASVLTFRNNIFDQVKEGAGALNYCVRWDSSATVSAQMRDQIAAALRRNVNEWFSKLVGYDCWPYNEIGVTITGWAVRNRDQLQWPDDGTPVYVNDIREDAPQCADACGRFFHQQAGYQYPGCAGGRAKHYDLSLWLTAGLQGGAGGDWGERVGSEYFTNNVNSTHIHIFLHEFGHGLGFPDYYNWAEWVPAGTAVPNSVMVAGLASLVTTWDSWMIRHTYSNIKSRLF